MAVRRRAILVSYLQCCPGGVEKYDPLLGTTTEIRSCILQSLCSRSSNPDSQYKFTRPYVEHPAACLLGTSDLLCDFVPSHGESYRCVWLKNSYSSKIACCVPSLHGSGAWFSPLSSLLRNYYCDFGPPLFPCVPRNGCIWHGHSRRWCYWSDADVRPAHSIPQRTANCVGYPSQAAHSPQARGSERHDTCQQKANESRAD